MPPGNQLTRQWRLLQLLDRPEGVAVEDAARDLGCVVRTIWRDLDVLQDAGFPIFDDPQTDGRRSIWRTREEFKRRPRLKLSLSELAALAMSREVLPPVTPNGAADGLTTAVATACDKITGVLSKDTLALLAQMRDTIGVRAGGAKLQAPAADHLRIIQAALAARRRLRLRYCSMSRDEATGRRADP